MKSRYTKLLLAFVSPPVMGSIIFTGIDVFIRTAEGRYDLDELLRQIQTLPIVILLAFVFVGGQALIYALLMEFLITPLVKKGSWFIVSSCLLGSSCGLTLLVILPEVVTVQLIFTGAAVGLVLGYWLFKINQRNMEKNMTGT